MYEIFVRISTLAFKKRSNQKKFPNYHKVASSSLSWLVLHFWIFRLFMKGKFYAYLYTVNFDQKSSKFTVPKPSFESILVKFKIVLQLQNVPKSIPFMLLQPVFMKSYLCALYRTRCKFSIRGHTLITLAHKGIQLVRKVPIFVVKVVTKRYALRPEGLEIIRCRLLGADPHF